MMQKSGTFNRVAIFATHDSEGIIDKYIIYCLKELKKVASDIIVVSNHELSIQQKEKLHMASVILERNDDGYDVGGYVCAIKYLKDKNIVYNYDELIIMNDSVFGPFYSLSDMFKEMDCNSKTDFWGVTARGQSDFDGSDAVYPKHIQLYFYVIRKKMFHSKLFLDYWDNILKKVTDFRSAIINYEFYFTNFFEQKGFNWDVYCKTPEYDSDNICNNLSPYHYCTYDLIAERKCPFMKRKLFTGDFIDGRYTNKIDSKNAVRYITQNTNYDSRLMWEHVLRIYPIATMIPAMQMTEIIYSETEMSSGCGMDDALNIIDLSTDDNKYHIDYKYNVNKSNYTIVMRFQFKNAVPDVLRKSYLKNVEINLMKNKNFISKIVSIFEKEELLGLMIPPIHYFDKFLYSINSIANKSLKSDLIDYKDHLCKPVHKINAFICRTSLLSEDILEELSGTDGLELFRYMPYIIQKKGYYTKIAVDNDWAVSLIENEREVLAGLWNSFNPQVDYDCSLDEMKDIVLKSRIDAFVENNNNLHIFGAGALAYKVVRLLGNSEKIKNIFVSDVCGNENQLLGIKVTEFNKEKVDGGIIIAVGRKNSENIEALLQTNGIGNYIIIE